MNANEVWKQAINDLACAECMFNNAISIYHTDLAIKAINNALNKIELLKEVESLNRNSEYT